VFPPHLEEARAAAALRAITIDPVLHDRTRLAIVAALVAVPALTFVEMRQLLGLTDGNLSVHARKLERVGYLATTRSKVGRASRTEFALTPAGRKALLLYLEQLEAIAAAARDAMGRGTQP
jgi:DNA-binding MarR family transcriptional regulator